MAVKIDFTKYQGCGNDFIIIDERAKEKIPEKYRGRVADILCPRMTSVGADDVIYVLPSAKADARFRIFAPGSGNLYRTGEYDMCGNGIRCFAAYLLRKLQRKEVTLETNAGLKHGWREGHLFRVDMPIEIKKEGLTEAGHSLNVPWSSDGTFIDGTLKFPSLGEVQLSIVSSGIPHAVIFVADAAAQDMKIYEREIAKNFEYFPYGMHLNLAEVLDRRTIKYRMFEKAVWNEPLHCGTGSCATAWVAYKTGRVKSSEVDVISRGGKLTIRMEGNLTYQTGPAVEVYTGQTEVVFPRSVNPPPFTAKPAPVT